MVSGTRTGSFPPALPDIFHAKLKSPCVARYPPAQHAGFVEAVASTSGLADLDTMRMQQVQGAEPYETSDEEPLPALGGPERPMSPEMRAWGSHAMTSVAQAQASAARAQSVAVEAARATWRVSTAGDLSRSPVIEPLPTWQGLQSACGPYPTQLAGSRLELESESVAMGFSEPKLHRGPRVDSAHPRRVSSPDRLMHKDRTLASTETIVCYLSEQEVGSADGAAADARAQLQRVCAAQINNHATPTTNLIKFTIAELTDPSRVTSARLKKLGPALSSYRFASLSLSLSLSNNGRPPCACVCVCVCARAADGWCLWSRTAALEKLRSGLVAAQAAAPATTWRDT